MRTGTEREGGGTRRPWRAVMGHDVLMVSDEGHGERGEQPIRVSVVFPAHEEEDYLSAAVWTVTTALRQRGMRFEVIIVENGSSDRTLAIAEEAATMLPEVRTLTLDRADYGAALRAGFLASTGDAVASFDVDFYDVDFLDRSLTLLDEGADLVIGTKRGPEANDQRSWVRRMVTGVFVKTLQLGFGLKTSDTHGIKVARRRRLRPLVETCRLGTDLFDTELVLRAERADLRLVEVGLNVEELRPPRSSIVRRSARTLVNLVRLRRVLGEDGRSPEFAAPSDRFSDVQETGSSPQGRW